MKGAQKKPRLLKPLVESLCRKPLPSAARCEREQRSVGEKRRCRFLLPGTDKPRQPLCGGLDLTPLPKLLGSSCNNVLLVAWTAVRQLEQPHVRYRLHVLF